MLLRKATNTNSMLLPCRPVVLQEGMFNNANVIFRTKFVDGVSTVTRTIGTGSSSRARALVGSQDNISESDAGRKRGARGVNRRGKENLVG